MHDRAWLTVAAALGFTAVAAGAFGAHGPEGAVDARAAGLVETGSRYQMWHALAMLAGIASRRPMAMVLRLWTVGAVLFPLSLYALALGAPPGLGLVTPIGGMALLLGWAALAWHALRVRA